jgi:hypothetical protein
MSVRLRQSSPLSLTVVAEKKGPMAVCKGLDTGTTGFSVQSGSCHLPIDIDAFAKRPSSS